MEILSLIAFVSVFLGMILLIIGLIIYRRKRLIYENAIKTEGVVIGFIKTEIDSSDENLFVSNEEDLSKGTPYAPKIEYTTKSNEKYEIEGVASSPPKYKIGDKVTLLYQENGPSKAIVDSFFDKWIIVLVMSVFGFVLLIFGVVIAVLG